LARACKTTCKAYKACKIILHPLITLAPSPERAAASRQLTKGARYALAGAATVVNLLIFGVLGVIVWGLMSSVFFWVIYYQMVMKPGYEAENGDPNWLCWAGVSLPNGDNRHTWGFPHKLPRVPSMPTLGVSCRRWHDQRCENEHMRVAGIVRFMNK